MNKIILFLSIFFLVAFCTASPAPAADCGGGWKVLPNYQNGSGGPCKMLGLDSHQGTCQQGQRYETLCDDASNGRYRTCQGTTPCRHQPIPSRQPEQTTGGDCTGSWKALSNYNPSQGSPCQALGLNTHQGTCQQGQSYETLCDDASNGRYRTCQGTRRCSKLPHPYLQSRERVGSATKCSGNWQTLRDYDRRQGSPCQTMGLSSSRGICEAGYRLETLCDETNDGRYKICEGTRRCK